MRFQVNDKLYELEFSRQRKQVTIRDRATQSSFRATSTYPYTTVSVVEVDPEEKDRIKWRVFQQAEVGCCTLDKYTVCAGRLQALKKLSRKKELSREFKSAIWQAYMSRTTCGKAERAEIDKAPRATKAKPRSLWRSVYWFMGWE